MFAAVEGQVTSLRAMAPTVYLPSLLFGIGQGAVVPVLVVSARSCRRAPVLVGGIAAVALAPAVASLGVVSGLAALVMGVWLPRYSRRPT
jgi:hypothetical protein